MPYMTEAKLGASELLRQYPASEADIEAFAREYGDSGAPLR